MERVKKYAFTQSGDSGSLGQQTNVLQFLHVVIISDPIESLHRPLQQFVSCIREIHAPVILFAVGVLWKQDVKAMLFNIHLLTTYIGVLSVPDYAVILHSVSLFDCDRGAGFHHLFLGLIPDDLETRKHRNAGRLVYMYITLMSLSY